MISASPVLDWVDEQGTRAPRPGPTPPSPYEMFILVVSLLVLAYLAADAFLPLDPEIELILYRLDTAICLIFLFDFVRSFVRAENKTRYFFTWGWIDLISSIPALPGLRWGRAARATRILRLLRGLRAARNLIVYLRGQQRSQGAFLGTILVALLSALFASIAVLEVERAAGGNIKEGTDALWWSIVTMATVGYGDHFPVTLEGRVVGLLLMIVGIGLFGVFTALMAKWFLAPQEYLQDLELQAIRQELVRIRAMLEARSGD